MDTTVGHADPRAFAVGVSPIQGDDCRPRRRSWPRFPLISPIRDSFESPSGELATPQHPHATNTGACSRDTPGPTHQLYPASCAHRRGRAAPSPLLTRITPDGGHGTGCGICRRTRKRVTGMAHPCAHNAARPHPVPRARASTTNHARTCNGATPAPATVRPWGHVACAPAAGRVSDSSTEEQTPARDNHRGQGMGHLPVRTPHRPRS